MSGRIFDLSREPPPADLSVDVLVVGSGSAGATAAWDLARAGRSVIVLEEGGDFTGLALTQRDAAMYDQLYMDRGGRATSDLGVSVLQGRVLGGGGIINAADVVPIHEGVLRHWVKRWGLTDYTPEALGPYERRALEELSANTPAEDSMNQNNRLLRDGAKALGWRGEVMMHNRVGCAGLGACLIGCPLDAKKSVRFVAVPGAIEAGARFFVRTRAVKIEDAGHEVKTVRARTLDPRGYHEQGELAIRAKVVILAANAIASAQLLLRSGVGNDHVGRHVSLQPQLPVTAWFPDREVRFFRGIPQSYAVTEFERKDDPEHGFWGFRVESIGGTPGIVSTMQSVLGAEGKERMTRYPRQAAALCLLPDEPVGTVQVESNGRLRIHYALTSEIKSRFRDAARAAAKLFLAAGAKEVAVPCAPPIVMRSLADLTLLDGMSLLPVTVPLISAHQQGGVRFASSPRDGAADPDGQIYGARGVYVFDSAGYPSSSSSHTMTPIMTTAHFLAARLAARAG